MSDEIDTDKIVNRWIVEYHCWRMWNEFLKSGTVTDGLQTFCESSDSLRQQNFGDHKTHGFRLLIHFMRKIAEAAKEASEECPHDVSSVETKLEEAISLLDYLSNTFTGVKGDELKEVHLCLRRYAVLVPLQKDDRKTAKAVFDRQWLHWKNAEEMNCRDQLAAIISNCESAKPEADFNKVILKCRRMLQKIMNGMSEPFLFQAAQVICRQLESSSSNNNDDRCDISDEKVADTIEQLSDSDDTSEAIQSAQLASPLPKEKSLVAGSKTTKISSVDDIWRPSTKWRKKGARKGTGKLPWSTVEEELVYQGVLAHGVGNWALVHTDFVPNRTNVDIKDKWRTMKRQGRLPVLASKFGPLPPDCLI